MDDYLARYRARKTAEAVAKVASGEIVKPPSVIPAADLGDVMREQLDVLIDAGPDDPRYLAAKAVLLAPFAVTGKKAMGVSA